MNNTLRWLAILPGSIAAALLSTVVAHLILYMTLTGSGMITPYPRTPELVLSPFVVALTLVWSGSQIAPNLKIETATVLFGIVLLLTGAALALGLTHTQIGNTQISVQVWGLPNLAAVVGAFIGLHLIRSKSAL